MVRATRSSTQHSPAQQPAVPTPTKHVQPPAPKASSKKAASKKRKRPSITAEIDPDLVDDEDDEGQPAAKQQRQEQAFKDAADTPLPAQDALQILNVLQSVDEHGLLDRAFPPPANDEPSSSRAQLSLRQLLADAQNHPLRVLRDAVQPLFPITSHARSRNSEVAQQQIRFCSLAVALLEQASRNTLDLSAPVSAFLDDDESAAPRPRTKRRYAMMQKLPNGEWWTSALASDDPRAGLSPRDAKALAHGQAELVSILPSVVDAPDDAPTLGDYAGPRKTKRKHQQQSQGLAIPKLPAGSFLDYGPYASFAPTFDADAAEVGRDALGALYDTKARRRLARQKHMQALREAAAAESVDDEAMQVDEQPSVPGPAIDPALAGVSSSEKKDDVDVLMGDITAELELERGVSELLQRNARALIDLEIMQLRRLKAGAPVEEGSEEWRTAHQILDTLVLLADLRPRGPDGDDSPLVPPPEVLHALQRTLPIDPGIGWKGTLEDKRQAALRDNNTVRVKVAGTAPAAAGASTTKAAAAAAATPQPYRPPPGFPFPPPSAYYPNAQFQTPAAAGAYPPWPGYFPFAYPPPPGGSGARDKNGALEAAQKFYGYAAPGAQGNAAKASPGAAQNGWYNAAAAMPGGVPVTLPPHLRRYSSQAFPGTPTPAGR